MINALHLLWIAPLFTMFGYFLACVMTMSKK